MSRLSDDGMTNSYFIVISIEGIKFFLTATVMMFSVFTTGLVDVRRGVHVATRKKCSVQNCHVLLRETAKHLSLK